jgi:hypothetical protein
MGMGWLEGEIILLNCCKWLQINRTFFQAVAVLSDGKSRYLSSQDQSGTKNQVAPLPISASRDGPPSLAPAKRSLWSLARRRTAGKPSTMWSARLSHQGHSRAKPQETRKPSPKRWPPPKRPRLSQPHASLLLRLLAPCTREAHRLHQGCTLV